MNKLHADISLIGLGVMGSNLVLNVEIHGYTVAIHNRTSSQIDNLVNNDSRSNNCIGFVDLDDFGPYAYTSLEIRLVNFFILIGF